MLIDAFITGHLFLFPMRHIDTHALKFIIGFCVVFAFRLIPFRLPNIEPVLATAMPFAKQFGATGGFFFSALSIILFDLVTSGLGVWTLITACAYGVVGGGAYWYFRNRESTPRNYVTYAVAGTLFYDAVTGLTIGPIFFGQPFFVAFFGQIPFTALHLLGSVGFAYFLSPILYRWVVMNERFVVSNVCFNLKQLPSTRVS
jgi:uncharacterized membrane protein